MKWLPLLVLLVMFLALEMVLPIGSMKVAAGLGAASAMLWLAAEISDSSDW